MEVSIQNWKSVKKWKFKTFNGMKIHHMMHFHHIIYIKIFIKKWKCAWKSTICHILQIWFNHSSSETIMISKILLHTLLYTHWPLGPLRSNHIIWWWKVVICWKVTMWWKVTINLQYKKDDDDGVSSYDVITSLMMTNRHDNAPIILLSYKGKERAVQSPQL